MATRTIVTSQPDVECDVCERRLLRGEQPDVFIGAGRRRIVCELCAPRAAHEGWLRESDSQSLTLPPMRARRGRSFFERLRQVARPPGAPATPAVEDATQPYDVFADAAGAQASVAAAPGRAQPAAEPTDLEATTPVSAVGTDAAPSAPAADAPATSPADGHMQEHAAIEQPSAYVEEAIAVFNASEFPRRVAGVTRSLGEPTVTVRSAEHLASVVSIVVAWELCWYRYEVDLSEPAAEAQVIAQGTELAELDREDRRANAAAAESGALVLTSA
jgi:hypothetical protein